MEKENIIEKEKNSIKIKKEKNPFQSINQNKKDLNNNIIIKGLINNIKIENKQKNKLGSLYNLIHSEYFTIDIIMQYLNQKNSNGIVDEIVHLIYLKFVNESFYYLPQLCSLIFYKDYYSPIKNYLLDCCVDKIKFSILVYWIISSKPNNEKIEEMLESIEMTLVNNQRSTISLFNQYLLNQNKSEYDILKSSFNKELRSKYFNKLISFYDKLKELCETLKNIKKSERNSYLRNKLVKFNKNIKINQLKVKDKRKMGNSIINLYHGIILPFNDHEIVNDENCNLIVKFIPELSCCFNTKARVPIKITCECVRVFECDNWENNIKNEINDIDEPEKHKSLSFNSIDDFFKTFDNQYKKMEIEEQQKKNEKEILTILNEIKKINKNPKKEKEKMIQVNKESLRKRENNNEIIISDFTPEIIKIFGEKWSDITEKKRKESIYSKFETYSLKTFIVKANDDLRQELLALQLIRKIDIIFKKAELNLKLFPYEILVTSPTSGLIEFLPNTISIDSLKKIIPSDWNLNIFYRSFYSNNFEEAQKNFCESLAAYSLITYILDIKDRHNGNIMIDINGNILHIDFGFILGISPGNLRFENAPFKLTNEYVDILDGKNSAIFQYFKSLLFKGFSEIKKNFDSLSQIIEIMAKGEPNLPCFVGRKVEDIIKSFKDRFHFKNCELEYWNLVDELIYNSFNNWRTIQYDNFQKLTNDIHP